MILYLSTILVKQESSALASSWARVRWAVYTNKGFSFLRIPLFLRDRLKLSGKCSGFKGNPQITGIEDNFKAEGVSKSFGYGVIER